MTLRAGAPPHGDATARQAREPPRTRAASDADVYEARPLRARPGCGREVEIHGRIVSRTEQTGNCRLLAPHPVELKLDGVVDFRGGGKDGDFDLLQLSF